MASAPSLKGYEHSEIANTLDTLVEIQENEGVRINSLTAQTSDGNIFDVRRVEEKTASAHFEVTLLGKAE